MLYRKGVKDFSRVNNLCTIRIQFVIVIRYNLLQTIIVGQMQSY